MYNESRMDLYDYVCGIFDGVSDNIYKMKIPDELTDSDLNDGFLVVNVGDVFDGSEFMRQAYGEVRVIVSAYIPLKSRGRLNKALYKTFESGMDEALNDEILHGNNAYYSCLSGGILSMDDIENANQDNVFSVYTKSFIISMDNHD